MNERFKTPFSKALAEQPNDRKAAVARFIGNIIARNRHVADEDVIERVHIFGDSSEIWAVPSTNKRVVTTYDLGNLTDDALKRADMDNSSYESFWGSMKVILAPAMFSGRPMGESDETLNEGLQGLRSFAVEHEIVVFDAGSIARRHRRTTKVA